MGHHSELLLRALREKSPSIRNIMVPAIHGGITVCASIKSITGVDPYIRNITVPATQWGITVRFH